MFKFLPVSERIQKMRKSYRTIERDICTARYRLMTEFYQNNLAMPGMLRKANSFKYLCENMPVRIDEWDIITGAATSKFGAGILHPEMCVDWLEPELRDGTISTRSADPYNITEEEKEYILDTIDFWKDKSLSAICTAAAPTGYFNHVGNGVSVFGIDGRAATPIGHFSPNYSKVIRKGFAEIKKDALQRIARYEEDGITGDTVSSYYFYQAIVAVSDGMMIFAKRYSEGAAKLAEQEKDPARKAELEMMSESLSRIIAYPCKTFYDALEATFLYQIALCLDANLNGLSLGRMDQYLIEYYERDIANGTITPEYAQEMMDSFFMKIAEVCKVSSASQSEAFPGYTSGQLMTLGGQNADGSDASNAVSYMMLQSAGRLLLHDPPLALRVHKNTPYEMWEAAIETTKLVGGIPTFQNDDTIIPQLMKRGFSYEDAVNYSLIGCVEPGGSGNDWSQTGGDGTECFFILPNAMLLALNNGYVTDKRTANMHLIKGTAGNDDTPKQVGLPTGYLYEMDSFDQVLDAVKAQIEFFVKWHVANTNSVEYVAREFYPVPLASATIDGCMESGKDVLWGGAKYNSTGIAGVGFGNVADSLQLIKYLCFDKKICTTRELYDALINDWKGQEELQQFIKGSAPHYGNNNKEADRYAKWLAKVYNDAVNSCTSPRGHYAAGLWPVATHIIFGKSCGATPDGRSSGTTLAEGISPVQQMDISGPTAMLQSAAGWDQRNVNDGTLLNMKIHPSAIQNEEGYRKLSELIKTYFKLGGMELQLNIVSAETLKAAQKKPDEYQDLVVRVAGFSTYFVALNTEAQDELISRTANRF